jgi:hypothetical protein
VVLEATHEAALKYIPRSILEEFGSDAIADLGDAD